MIQRPNAISLILCEQVVVEEGTRNLTFVNCFNKRELDGFPSRPFPFVVLALLTDGMGKMTLQLSVQRLDTNEEIYSRSLQAHFPDQLSEARISLVLRDFSFPVAGRYLFSLFANGELIAQRRLDVLQRESHE